MKSSLVAPDMANTLPRATLGVVEIFDGTIAEAPSGASMRKRGRLCQSFKDELNLADVADVLERQGVTSVAQSWDELHFFGKT